MDQHPNDYREQFYKRQLDVCEQAWRGGNFPAVLDAMEYCAEANMPPPPWLIAASETLVSSLMLVRTGRGRFNSVSRPPDIFQAIGFRRYNAANSPCETLGGSTWTKLSFSLTEKPTSG
jgi:hypothetical protein